MNKFALFFITFSFCFQALSSNVKSLDFNPAETLQPSSSVRTIKLDDKLVFVTYFEEGFKLWRQEEGSEKVEEYFDGTDSYVSSSKILRWDNNKIIFWSQRDNEEDSKWYQTDGTKANTHEFHTLNKLYKEYSLGSADVLFVTSIDDENELFFIKGLFHSDYKLAAVKYNKSADNFEIIEGFDEDVFGGSADFIARLGDYIFAKNFMGFYRINMLDMQIDELIENDIGSINSSYHFQYTESATTVDNTADPVVPLIDFGFLQIYRDGKFSTYIIDGVSGDILTLPIESEYQFSSKVLQNSHSFYIALGGADYISDSVLYQLKKKDFSLKQIETQTVKPDKCTNPETFSHKADKVTEEGVLVRETYWCNQQQTLDTLSFVNELSSESHQLKVDNGTLNYTLNLQETSTNTAFYSAYNHSDDETEVWKVNLSNMELNRVHIPSYFGINKSALGFFPGYSLNDNYYLYSKDSELVSDSNSTERELVTETDGYNWGPLLTNKVNTDTGTVDPVHHFSKNILSEGQLTGDFIETSEGVFLHSEAWVDGSKVSKFYKFEQDYQLSLVAEINREGIVQLGYAPTQHYYSNANSPLIYYITENSESNQYYLNSLNLTDGETWQEAELLNDQWDRAPEGGITIEDGYALIAYGRGVQNVDYLKVKLNNGSQTLFDAIPVSCGAYDVVSGYGVFDSDGDLVQQLAGKIMSTQDGYIIIYDDYYLPDSRDIEAKVSVLDCGNLEVTELMTFSTEDRVVEGGMFLGLDNWVYLTQGGGKNHRVKASDMVIEAFLLESARDLSNEIPSSFYQNENGIYRFFSSGQYKTKEVSTTVEKYSGDNVSTVATSTANFMPDLYKQPEDSSRLFTVFTTEFRDAMYFDMNAESFVEIEVTPGKDSFGYLFEGDYLIASNGMIYLKSGVIGADLTIINTACNDTEKCDFPFGSNPPTVVNHKSYKFTAEQSIYIPIRAKDPDSDITSYKLSNAPNWLSIQNDVIIGSAPSDVKSDIENIILHVEDSNSNLIEHHFSLIYTAKKRLTGQNIDSDGDGVLDPEDAFPLDANESVDTDADGIGNNADTDDDNDGVLDADDAYPLDSSRSSNSNSTNSENSSSSSSGGGSMYILLYMLFISSFVRSKHRSTKRMS